MPRPRIENNSADSPITQVIDSSSRMRVIIASDRPMVRPRAPLLRRQPADQDGNENDVVDAEDDLQSRQRQKRQPHLGIGQEFHSPDLMR